jgi:hypothetical protein
VVFASAWDAALFAAGPPSVFTLDPKGELRVDPERTREAWLLVGERDGTVPTGREEAHFVLRDRVTGLRMYLLVTHPELATRQTRAEATRYPDHASAVAKAAEQWAPRG